MRYAWLPAPYLALWVTFLLGLLLRFLQTRDPEEYERYHGLGITDLGHRLTMTCGPLLFFATLWIAHVSWERVIRQKRKRPHVELTQVEQFYGGAVFVRKIPRRVWNAAGEGDRLIKPKWGLLVRHQPRR